MSGFCGWFLHGRGQPVDTNAAAAFAAEANRLGKSETHSVVTKFGCITSEGTNVSVYEGDRQLTVVWGQPNLKDSQLKKLARQHGVAYAVAHGYEKNGVAVLESLGGSFAIALISDKAGEAILATDRMGTRPVYYGNASGALVFGSMLGAISHFPEMPINVSPQAIYNYVHFHMVPGPGTIYEDRYRLLPGSFLIWRDGKAQIHSYWKMQFSENVRRPFSELKSEFLSVLRGSVRDAANNGVVGTFLSGGTDSSTMAGMLGEVTAEPARTYSIGFEAKGYDEMQFARIAARHFRTHHHEYYVTPDDVVKAIPRIAAAHDQPFGNSSAVPTYYCAELARNDGVDTLLGGDGGDELFGGNERYAKQYLYSLYSDLPAAVRNCMIEPMLNFLPSVSLIKKVQRVLQNASMPMPARYDHYNLLQRMGAREVFTDEFLDTVDVNQPMQLMADEYARFDTNSLINRMLALDLRFTLADNDLPKVNVSCALAGVNPRFPMLSDEVVEFSTQLSPRLKLKGTRLRYFFKEALTGFLPDEIITKPKQGFGLPFGLWLKEHRSLQDLVGDTLYDLKGRRIVHAALIDRLLGELLQSQARYYGTLAWVLMMLEQWFKQHGTNA